MTVFSKLWNANVPSGQFRDDNVGSMTTAPNKHWCGATSKLIKGALVIAGVTGTSWVAGKAIRSANAKANDTDTATAALLLKEASAKATKAAKTGSPKAKAGKGGEEPRPPSILARSKGELVSKLEWVPNCGLSEDECEKIFCDGVETVLKNKLSCDSDDCNLALTCAPKVPKRANRALLVSYRAFTFSISLLVECTTTPDCSDTVQEETAAEAAMLVKKSNFQGIAAQQFIDGVRDAIAQMSPPEPAGEFFTTFSFTFDPASAGLSDPTIVVVPNDVTGPFEFVGEGFCKDSKGKSHPYIRADDDIVGDLTLQECATWVNQPLITGCQGFVGFQYNGGTSMQCYALYDVKTYDPTGYEPSNICEVPTDIDCDHSGSGVGPIAQVSDRTGVLCYKFTG